MKLNLNDFDKIIFDMDGVITSEYIYWDTAALTIYELLFDYKFYGKHDIDREWCRKNYKEISDTIFCGEKTIRAVKRLGVNTNWDLAYIVFCVSKYIEPCLERLDKAHFDAVCMFIENITTLAPKLYEHIEGLAETVIDKDKGFFKRSGTGFWTQMHAGFQDWFNGFDGVEGLNSMEKPLLPLGDIKSTLKSLK
ncbi:MAG: hypothetical protein RSA27_06605, partial [Oscillospiraceae bacterium]